MARYKGVAPEGAERAEAVTLFLRVPAVDWPRLVLGEKTEFRTTPREGSRITKAKTPTPVVAYRTRRGHDNDYKLMVLEEFRREPLFEVSQHPELLKREGFENYDLFRRYWRARQHREFVPMEVVQVWRVRSWEDGDLVRQGFELLKRLYGAYL
ncbi:MAG: hypothetical protein ACJ8AT_39580 [Hyalangium sp.]|uniref:hypothetical protein n=1 Tax=Hyalangium sp. TaxID=2028555 RepID=UPI00389A57C6